MFSPRLTTALRDSHNPRNLKRYTISASGKPVDSLPYQKQLDKVASGLGLDWDCTAAFVIFHEGTSLRYLVLAWWGNDNELFNSVSVEDDGQWIEDNRKFSFCLWDLEVIWHERNSYIQHMYSGNPDIEAYRTDLYLQ